MLNFHNIGMKHTDGKGLDEKGEYSPEGYATGILYLEKSEKKLGKMSREKFNKLWNAQLIKLGDYGYNKDHETTKRYHMAKTYLAGRNGEGLTGYYPDLYHRGQADAAK